MKLKTKLLYPLPFELWMRRTSGIFGSHVYLDTLRSSVLLPTIKIALSIILGLFILSGCSSYKSTWDCPLEQGIGCSSIGYADEVAKQEIYLNAYSQIKEVLFNENTGNFDEVFEQ